MKKLFTLLLIIPILGFSQNDLVFNKVRNIFLAANQTATVPAGKVWKVESALPELIYLVHDGDDDFGISSDGGNVFAALTVTGANASGGNAIWIEEGNTIKTGGAASTQALSILEFNVVAASSGSGGSGAGVSADGFAASGIINLALSGTNSSGNLATITDLGNLTVPEGKIWKLGSNNFTTGNDPATLSYGSGYGGNLYVDGFYFSPGSPLYLSAGTYEVTGKSTASGGGGVYYILAKLGGLEYNAN